MRSNDSPSPQSRSGSASFWREHSISILIILLAVLVVYLQAVRFEFIHYDDDELVYKNVPYLSQWSNIVRSFTTHAFVGAGGESVYYRPLLLVSFIIEYHLWGINPAGYHLVSILLHALTSLLVYLLVRKLAGREIVALGAAVLFALHPVQTESVAWIAGRNDVLLGLWIVLMILFKVRARTEPEKSRRNEWYSVLFFALALFTKESAAFYLLLVPAYDLWFHRFSFRALFSTAALRQYALFALVLVVYMGIRLSIFGAFIGAERMYGHTPVMDRFIQMPPIVAEHCNLLLAPIHLSVAHPLPDIIWLQFPWNGVSFLFFLVLAVGILRPGSLNGLAWFGLAWLLTGLLPVMNIFPLAIPILEHRLYVPSVGFSIVLVSALEGFFGILRQDRYLRYGVLILSVAYAALTTARLPVWHDGVSLFSDAVAKAPGDGRSYYSLAQAYYDRKDYAMTARWLGKYLDRLPNDIFALTFLRETYYVQGRYDSVAALCKRILRIEPDKPARYLETGVIFEQMGLLDSAIGYYKKGIRIDSTVAQLHERLGVVYSSERRYVEALGELSRAIALEPTGVETYTLLGKLYHFLGRDGDAVRLLEEGLGSCVPDQDYLGLLAGLYRARGETAKESDLRRRFNF